MERVLTARGFEVVNQAYPSTKYPIKDLYPAVGQGVAKCTQGQPVHLVTHSMGGILARMWLSRTNSPKAHRVVLLGPPNGGSELVDQMGSLKPFQWVNGPAGVQLGTRAGSVPNRLEPPQHEMGVIAGTRSMNPLYSAMIDGVDDGKVSVASTRLQGAKDHIALPVTHTFMMSNPRTIFQVLQFLENGRFAADPGYWAAVRALSL